MLEFLSFIVVKLFKGMGFNEIKGLAQTMSKGLNFLYLWGEGSGEVQSWVDSALEYPAILLSCQC